MGQTEPAATAVDTAKVAEPVGVGEAVEQTTPAEADDTVDEVEPDPAPQPRPRRELFPGPRSESRTAIPVAPPPVSAGLLRDGDIGQPSTRPSEGRGRREVIALASIDPGPVSVREARSIDPPPVLAGNPRLGSTPGNRPTVVRTVPDSVVDGADITGLGTVRAASVRGDDHRFYGETRQDAMGFWLVAGPTDDPVLLAAVADGVGSKPLSHLGSQHACDALQLEVRDHVDALVTAESPSAARPHCEEVVRRTSDHLRAYARKWGEEPRNLSTTLTAAIVHPTADGVRALLFAAGDSTAFVHGKDGWRPCYRSDDPDGMYETRTDALPDNVGTLAVADVRLNAGDLLVLCTDGLANPMRDAGIRDQLAAWWAGGPPELTEFYWQFSFRAQTYGDDRTAVCVWVR